MGCWLRDVNDREHAWYTTRNGTREHALRVHCACETQRCPSMRRAAGFEMSPRRDCVARVSELLGSRRSICGQVRTYVNQGARVEEDAELTLDC